MVSAWTWLRYISHKFDYSCCLALSYSMKRLGGEVLSKEVGDALWRNFLHEKLTYLHRHKGREMAPTIGDGGMLLVRRIPIAQPIYLCFSYSPDKKDPFDSLKRRLVKRLGSVEVPEMVSIGDVVVMKDPDNPESHLVRRLAAIGEYKMVSTDETEDPFLLQRDQCWVLSDNEALKPKEAKDSRTFGPVHLSNIMGRVIYCMQNAVDHGPIRNSSFSMREDVPVLKVELDVDEMVKNHKDSP